MKTYFLLFHPVTFWTFVTTYSLLTPFKLKSRIPIYTLILLICSFVTTLESAGQCTSSGTGICQPSGIDEKKIDRAYLCKITCPEDNLPSTLATHIKSNQIDDQWWNGQNLDLKLEAQLPEPIHFVQKVGVNKIAYKVEVREYNSNIVYSGITWNGPNTNNFSSNGNTASITNMQSWEETYTTSGGIVTFDRIREVTSYKIDPKNGGCILHCSQTCTNANIQKNINPAVIIIYDGNQIRSSNSFVPDHYWTFESASPDINVTNEIHIDGVNYDIPPNGSTPWITPEIANPNIYSMAVGDSLIDIMTINQNAPPYYTTNNLRRKDKSKGFEVESGLVGKCAIINDKIEHYVFYDPNGEKRLTSEFMIQFDENLLSTNVNYYSDQFVVQFEPSKITIGARFTRSGNAFTEIGEIPLTGIERSEWEYYNDGQWHHFAITADLERGLVKLFVDGISPEGFRHQYFPELGDVFVNNFTDLSGSAYSTFTLGNHYFTGQYEFGLFDEYALYLGTILPSSLILEHYNDVMAGNHYSFIQNFTYKDANTPNNVLNIQNAYVDLIDNNYQLDPREYPIGYDPQNDGLSDLNIQHKPIEQVLNSPFPRYLPDNTLLRNFNWFDIYRMGGHGHVSNYGNNAAELNEELALHWNYYTEIGGKASHGIQIQQFANSHPEIPAQTTLYWNQLKPSNLSVKNLSPSYYLKDENGNDTLNLNPACPLGPLTIDGQNMHKSYLLPRLKGLQRPINLISENGEVYPDRNTWIENKTNHYFNPDVQSDYTAYGGTWKHYTARQKARLRNAYRDGLLEHDPLLLTNNTQFNYYSIDGLGGHKFFGVDGWEELRSTQKNFPNSDHYRYATPDFYPKSPENWSVIDGYSHGTDWLWLSRHHEIASGDSLFSPFVSAGWKENPTDNIRPGQWLGLLKTIGVLGVEFYHTGYFSESPICGGTPLNNPYHWAWQTLMPSYAQAILSRYEEILRHGTLLRDSDIFHQDDKSNYKFDLKGGSVNAYTIAKRWENPNNSDDVQYIISTTLQRQSNYTETLEQDLNLKDFDDGNVGSSLKLVTRRQGSTYHLRKHENLNEWVLIQLDSWHEPWHPERWSKDYVFEAEVPDEVFMGSRTPNDPTYMTVRTENNQTGLPQYFHDQEVDFRDFTSFYSFLNGDEWDGGDHHDCAFNREFGTLKEHPRLSYKFRVKSSSETYRLFIRAKSRNNTSTAAIIQLVDENRKIQIQSDYISCIDSAGWKWYSIGVCDSIDFSGLEAGYYYLDIIPDNVNFMLDQVVLDHGKNSSLNQLTSPITCDNTYPYNVEECKVIDYTYTTACSDAAVTFSSFIFPKLPASCGQEIKLNWIVFDVQGSFIDSTGTDSSHIVLNYSIFSGTHENPKILFPGPGIYEVTMVVNIDGVIQSIGKTIEVYPSATVDIEAYRLNNSQIPNGGQICTGQKVILKAITNPSGWATEYSWFPSLTTLQSNSQQTEAYPNKESNDRYVVTVTDVNGCTAISDTFTFRLTPPLDVVIEPINGGDTLCYGRTGESSNPFILEAKDGNGNNLGSGLNYSWKGQNITGSSTGSSINLLNSDGLETERYFLTVIDVSTQCVGSDTFDLVVSKSIIDVDVVNKLYHPCIGGIGSELLEANISYSGSQYPLDYTWTTESILTSPITALSGTTTGSIPSGGNMNLNINAGDGSTELTLTRYVLTLKDTGHCVGKGYAVVDPTYHVNVEIDDLNDQCQGTKGPIQLNSNVNCVTNSNCQSPFTYSWSTQGALGGSGTSITGSTNTQNTSAGNASQDLMSTKYTLVATDQNGCYGIDSTHLKVNDQINASITFPTSDTCVPSGTILNLKATPIQNNGWYNYTWQPSQYGPFGTSFITNPVNFQTSTAVQVIVTDQNGCWSSDDVFIQVGGCSSAKKANEEDSAPESSDIIIYPNPNSGAFTLEFGNLLRSDEFNISVIDLSGRTVWHTRHLPNNGSPININGLSTGIYLVNISSNLGVHQFKIVVQ